MKSFRSFRVASTTSFPVSRATAKPLTICFALALATAISTGSLLAPSPASAAQAWVKGERQLMLRAGAGTQYKIIGSVKTGDELTVLTRAEKWTRVKTPDNKTGWIAAGFLLNEPPPVLRVKQLETEAANLSTQLEELRAETSKLRESNATLTSTDSGQRAEIEALKLENFELRAGARYQEWITGALILALGMIVGAFLHRRNSTRRGGSRIRL